MEALSGAPVIVNAPEPAPVPCVGACGITKGTAMGKDKVQGESGGGAYPNPHTGKVGKRGGFMDHGGQTGMAYHGTGRLGEDKVGDNANAPTGGSDEGEDGAKR